MHPWYLLYRKVGYKTTTGRIEALGVEVFQPTMIKIMPRTDCNAVRRSEQLMFPAYLFLSFDINKVHTSAIKQVSGVVNFVNFGSQPCIVPLDVIQALKCKPYADRNEQDSSVECWNIQQEILDKIHKIADITLGDERESALMTLISEIQNQM